MSAPRLAAVCLAAAVLASTARAEPAPDLGRLFPHQADVFVTPPGGLAHLPLPEEVMAACRPGLSDLRVFDRDGVEIPYFVDHARRLDGPTEVTTTTEAVVLEVGREELRREDGPPVRRETYLVAAPVGAAAGGRDLVFETPRSRFVRRLEVIAIGADGTETALDTGGSIFRLPNTPSDKARVPIPAVSAPRLRIVLEGEDDAYLEPRLRWSTARTFGPAEQMAVPLEQVERRGGAGRTSIVLARPRGVVPAVVRLETTTEAFDRMVEVWDERPGAEPVRLGGLRLFRVPADALVEQREIPVRAAEGDHLRVEITDGDSPPLENTTFSAVVRQPAIVLMLAADSPDRPAATLRFGGGRAHAPRYDLAGLASAVAQAVADDRIHGRPAIAPAWLGEPRDNPGFDGAPVLAAFAARPAAEIDMRIYTHLRPITVPASPEGLSRLRLDPDDQAVARPDLGDVRIVDAEARQWPYLVSADAAAEEIELPVVRADPEDGASRYRFVLPVAPLRVDRITLATDAPFFDRTYRLTATVGEAKDNVVTQGRLTRRNGRPDEQTIPLRVPTNVRALELAIDDGDDAPLPLRKVTARVLLAELYLTAPAGSYSMLLGHPDVPAPTYELARARDLVLTASSVPVATGNLTPNPDWSRRLATGEAAERVLPQAALWTVLLSAVAMLAWLTLRAARREGPTGGESA